MVAPGPNLRAILAAVGHGEALYRGRQLYSSTLVPIDLEEPSSWSKAVPTALAQARCFEARLTLAAVVEDRVAAREA